MSERVGTVAFGGRDDLSNIEWIGFDRSHTPRPYQGGKEPKQFILSDELSTMLSHDQREILLIQQESYPSLMHATLSPNGGPYVHFVV